MKSESETEDLDGLFNVHEAKAVAAPVHEGHHPFGFSALQKLAVCSGYRSADEDEDERDSASRAGDAGHAALQQAVETFIDVAFESETEPAPFVEYAEEASVSLGLEDWDRFLVRRAAEQLAPLMETIRVSGGKVITEDRLHLKGQSGLEISYGHPDLVWVDPTHTIAVIKDYKFGKIETPPAFQNMQVWAIAVVLKQMHPTLLSVEASLLHPQIQEWSTHTFSAKELDENLKVIEAVIARASSEHKRLVPGDHCHYCRHRAGCPALFGALPNAAISIGDPLVDFPKLHKGMVPDDPRAAAAVIYYIKLLETHASDWKAQARAVLERHGDEAELPLKDGTSIRYSISYSKGSDKLVAKPPEIAKVLDGLISADDLLSIANKPALGKLEALAVAKMQDAFSAGGATPPSKKILSEKFREMCKSKGILKSAEPGEATSQIRQTKPRKV